MKPRVETRLEIDTRVVRRKTRTVTLYRDDSTTQVVFEDVKHTFWIADNTVLVLAQYTDLATGAHRYIQWPRERFCWYKDEPDHEKS